MSIPLPDDFKHSLLQYFGEDFTQSLCLCLDAGKGNKSIRFNTNKFQPASIVQPVLWYDKASIINGDPVFAYDPAWHAGAYYVQEAASMFVEQALNATGLQEHDQLLCLDLCAAPGGKSTLISSWLQQRGTLISNEIISSRSEILKENLIKWGLGNAIVTNNDPSAFENLGEIFDIILVDAPCSGEGLFRRDLDARTEWSLKQVQVNVERQRSILANAWKCLKEGGFLIYSTCTFNPKENEEQITYLKENFGAETIDIPLKPEWNIVKESPDACYRFFPHLTAGEGFALTLLKKTTSVNSHSVRHKSKSSALVQAHKKLNLSDYLELKDYPANCYSINEQLLALTEQQVMLCQQVLVNHYIKYAGTDIGSFKQKDMIPAHALSQSVHLKSDCFEKISLSYEEAILYLRREQTIPALAKGKGTQVAKYHDASLGFMKVISPTRANNYYPNEWRIRQAPELNLQEKFLLEQFR